LTFIFGFSLCFNSSFSSSNFSSSFYISCLLSSSSRCCLLPVYASNKDKFEGFNGGCVFSPSENTPFSFLAVLVVD
jgi:glutamine amidotransferase-like uncharacterized protein